MKVLVRLIPSTKDENISNATISPFWYSANPKLLENNLVESSFDLVGNYTTIWWSIYIDVVGYNYIQYKFHSSWT